MFFEILAYNNITVLQNLVTKSSSCPIQILFECSITAKKGVKKEDKLIYHKFYFNPSKIDITQHISIIKQ